MKQRPINDTKRYQWYKDISMVQRDIKYTKRYKVYKEI